MIPSVQPVPALQISALQRGLPETSLYPVFHPDATIAEVTPVAEIDVCSPSLRGHRAGDLPACEMKFLLDETTALAVEERLRPQLSVDPYSARSGSARSGSALAGSAPLRDARPGYHITTLYCDTPGWSVFNRRGRHRLSKFRLRRYDDDSRIFLERKSKRGLCVRKRRSTIEVDRLGGFVAEGFAAEGFTCEGEVWYRNQLIRNQLAPVCLVEYDRTAYCGASVEGPLRLTFDRRLGGVLHNEWSIQPRQSLAPLLAGKVVCEFKFRGALPSLFKAAIAELQLAPCGVSKYRLCVQASGIVASDRRLAGVAYA